MKWLCLCRNMPGSVLTRLSLFPPTQKAAEDRAGQAQTEIPDGRMVLRDQVKQAQRQDTRHRHHTNLHDAQETCDYKWARQPSPSINASWNKTSQFNYLNQYLLFQERNILSSGGERKQVSSQYFCFFLF